MKNHTTVIVASVLALLLAGGIVARIQYQRDEFDTTVRKALETSEGYDQRFIDMVNRLEYELTLRASFGYTGQKDPMTGRERVVVMAPRAAAPARVQADMPEVEVDPVKLTAIIFEEERKVHTAIVMDLDRSYSVEVGDKVAGRRITKITGNGLYMEDETALYYYDIAGEKRKREK